MSMTAGCAWTIWELEAYTLTDETIIRFKANNPDTCRIRIAHDGMQIDQLDRGPDCTGATIPYSHGSELTLGKTVTILMTDESQTQKALSSTVLVQGPPTPATK